MPKACVQPSRECWPIPEPQSIWQRTGRKALGSGFNPGSSLSAISAFIRKFCRKKCGARTIKYQRLSHKRGWYRRRTERGETEKWATEISEKEMRPLSSKFLGSIVSVSIFLSLIFLSMIFSVSHTAVELLKSLERRWRHRHDRS